MSITYKQAGVDIEAGDSLVRWIQKTNNMHAHAQRITAGVGGFAALFDGRFPEMKNPQLVACTDGVGTKVKLAVELNRFAEVGQDLVAMSVNDLICSGAEPLFFLDYYATGKLELEKAQQFLSGVIKACRESGCALIGGETAEMPGVYHQGDFDCAGFAVGVVDQDKILGSHRVQPADLLVGIGSSGFHSNGFSLVRKLWKDDAKDWAEQLLAPTVLYPAVAKELKKISGLKALAHITGGGMDNILRVLPKHLGAALKGWELPELFQEAQRRGKIPWSDLLRTFNCGIGLVAVVEPASQAEVERIVRNQNLRLIDVGVVENMKQQKWTWPGVDHE